MTEEKKAPTLRFEEGMKQFMRIDKGVSYFRELAVDMYLGEEHIGHIRASGKITVSGHVTAKDPSTIMSYANTFTFEQWMEIGARAAAFIVKCDEREAKFSPAFKRLEALAAEKFSESKPFGCMEIAKRGHDHLVIGGGQGAYSTYAPGIYTYDDIHYGGEEVKVGYRSVEEQWVKGVNNLGDEMLLELVKAASSTNTLEG